MTPAYILVIPELKAHQRDKENNQWNNSEEKVKMIGSNSFQELTHPVPMYLPRVRERKGRGGSSHSLEYPVPHQLMKNQLQQQTNKLIQVGVAAFSAADGACLSHLPINKIMPLISP